MDQYVMNGERKTPEDYMADGNLKWLEQKLGRKPTIIDAIWHSTLSYRDVTQAYRKNNTMEFAPSDMDEWKTNEVFRHLHQSTNVNIMTIKYTSDATDDNYDNLIGVLHTRFKDFQILLDTGFQLTVQFDFDIDLHSLSDNLRRELVISKIKDNGIGIKMTFDEFNSWIEKIHV